MIDFIQTEEGIAHNNSGGNYSYEYNLSDHFGNVRVSFRSDPVTVQLDNLQKDDYYAFGLRNSILAGSTENKYLYNGKELQEELGQYDYGARFYDPVIGRFNNVDPLSEKFMNFTGYTYAINNPINVYDPEGRDAIFTIERDKDGNITGVKISATIYMRGSGASEEKSKALNKASSGFFKSKESDGLNVSFDVKYVYNESIDQASLKSGENLLEFNSDPLSASNRSHINGFTISKTNSEGSTFEPFTGNTGVIYDGGVHEINSIFHESMHLLGISDRYTEGGNFLPNKGFENDIMGNPYNKPVISPIHYKSFSEAAWRFGGKSFLNNRMIDIDSRLNFIHTPESDKAREDRMKKRLKQ